MMLNTKILLLAVIFLLSSLAMSQSAAGTFSGLVTESDEVKLGDLFDDAGKHADIVVGSSPPPGKQTAYRATYLASLARKYGFNTDFLAGRKFLLVSRASSIVPRHRIEEVLIQAVLDSGMTDRFDIEFSGRKSDLHVELGSENNVEISITDFQLQKNEGRFYATLSAPAGTSKAQQVTIFGRIKRLKTVPVLARALAKGSIISEFDIDWIEVPANSLRRNAILDENQIIGAQTKSNLSAGNPITARNLRIPLIVAKGKLVNLSLRYNGLSLSLTGRALADGSMGSIIPIMNLQSKRTIHAEVIGKDAVRVHFSEQVAAAAAD